MDDRLHGGRHLNWPDLHNARDLGGLPTLRGAHTCWRRLVRADNLHALDDAGAAALRAYGIRTVIDLRHADERAGWPNHFERRPHPEIRFVAASITGEEADPEYEPINAPLELLPWLRVQLDVGGRFIVQILRHIADAPEGGVLFHCHAGKDRTGLIAQFLLQLAGVPDEVIIEDYLLSNARNAARHQAHIAQFDDPAERERQAIAYVVSRDVIEGALQHLRQTHGTAEDYLRAHGLADTEIARLRARLT